MKKITVVLFALVIWLLVYIVVSLPSIQRWNKVEQLINLQNKWKECEELQKTSHDTADNIRKELGLQQPALTGQTNSKILSNQIIE